MVNPVDAAVSSWFNQWAHRSPTFDSLVVLISGDDLLKGGVFMAFLWWAWFRRREDRNDPREYLLPTMITCVVAVLVARLLAAALPFRARPIDTPGFPLRQAFTFDPSLLIGWSSFPSDHAVMFFALATGVFFISRSLGLVAYLYVLLSICLPRIYLGIHWPTDILAGSLIGIGFGYLGNRPRMRDLINRPVWQWQEKQPAWFYAGLFLLTYQAASLFDGARHVAGFAFHTLKTILGSWKH